jgi:hypothetical protein
VTNPGIKIPREVMVARAEAFMYLIRKGRLRQRDIDEAQEFGKRAAKLKMKEEGK